MALPNFEDSNEFSAVEKLVLRYSVAMSVTPVEVSDELFNALRQHFGERQLVELTSAIAWETTARASITPLESNRKDSTEVRCACSRSTRTPRPHRNTRTQMSRLVTSLGLSG